jgi:hypothetical protein
MPKLTMLFEVFRADPGVPTVSVATQYPLTRRYNAFAVGTLNEEHGNVYRARFNIGVGD